MARLCNRQDLKCAATPRHHRDSEPGWRWYYCCEHWVAMGRVCKHSATKEKD